MCEIDTLAVGIFARAHHKEIVARPLGKIGGERYGV